MKKILIIEDEPLILKVYATFLEKKGFEIFTAKNGKEGLKTALEKKPDILLLDILMPVMDGMSMLIELRKDSWGKNANVLVLTNLSVSEDQKFVEEYHALGFLIKADNTLEQVFETIKKYIGE